MTSIDDDIWDYYADYYNISFPEKDAAGDITLYVSPFLLLLGTVGNLLSMIVMYRLSHQVLSTCIYLSLVAVVDLLVLYTRCGNEWLTNFSQYDLSNMLMVSSESVCKVYPFVFNFIFHLSKWLMVCTSVEGFIATHYPEKASSMCSLSRAKSIVLFLTVVLIIVNIHYFWSFELIFLRQMDVPRYYCTFAKHGHQQSEFFLEVIWPIMDLLIAEIMPYCIVIICGGFMLIGISRGRHRGDLKHQAWRRRYQLHPSAMDELQITIIVLCIHFIVLTLPEFINVIFTYIVNKYSLLEFSLELESRQILANTVCSTLEHLFLAAKVLIYAASSEEFRKETRKVFCICRIGRKARSLITVASHHSAISEIETI